VLLPALLPALLPERIPRERLTRNSF
jgi:hypothetical protein